MFAGTFVYMFLMLLFRGTWSARQQHFCWMC